MKRSGKVGMMSPGATSVTSENFKVEKSSYFEVIESIRYLFNSNDFSQSKVESWYDSYISHIVLALWRYLLIINMFQFNQLQMTKKTLLDILLSRYLNHRSGMSLKKTLSLQIHRTPPEEKRRAEKALALAASQEVYVLLLTPFTTIPRISFDRIKLGTSSVRQLVVRNPGIFA